MPEEALGLDFLDKLTYVAHPDSQAMLPQLTRMHLSPLHSHTREKTNKRAHTGTRSLSNSVSLSSLSLSLSL